MRCAIYPSSVHDVQQCLVLPEGKMLSDLPSEILGRFRHAEVCRTIELNRFKRYAGLDATTALAEIESQGFHVTHAGRDVIEEWSG